MSQSGRFITGGGGGTVTSVAGGNNITITGTATDPIVNVSGTTNHALQVGNATNSLTSLTVATDGQIPIGSTGADPVIANITAGVGITILNGPGSISISSASGVFNWQVITVNQAAVAHEGYFTNAGGVVVISLPAVSAVGDTFQIAAMSAGGWMITQGAGQQIRLGNQATTVGGAGAIASTAIGDWITLVCNVANTNWMARMEQGNANVS